MIQLTNKHLTLQNLKHEDSKRRKLGMDAVNSLNKERLMPYYLEYMKSRDNGFPFRLEVVECFDKLKDTHKL